MQSNNPAFNLMVAKVSYDINLYHPRHGLTAVAWMQSLPDSSKRSLLEYFYNDSTAFSDLPQEAKQTFLLSLVFQCINDNHHQTLQFILDKFKEDVTCYKSLISNTLLHLAAEAAAPECLSLLLKSSAVCYLEQKNSQQQTPANLALHTIKSFTDLDLPGYDINNHLIVLQLLKDAGAEFEDSILNKALPNKTKTHIDRDSNSATTALAASHSNIDHKNEHTATESSITYSVTTKQNIMQISYTYDPEQFHPKHGTKKWDKEPVPSKMNLITYHRQNINALPTTEKQKFLSDLITLCIKQKDSGSLEYILTHFQDNINSEKPEFSSLLHLAVAKHNPIALNFLTKTSLKNCIHKKDHRQRTPIFLAFEMLQTIKFNPFFYSSHYHFIIMILLKSGADLEIENIHQKNNPYAIALQNPLTMDFLLSYKKTAIDTINQYIAALHKAGNVSEAIKQSEAKLQTVRLSEHAYAPTTKTKLTDYKFIYGDEKLADYHDKKDEKSKEQKHTTDKSFAKDAAASLAFKNQFFSLLDKLNTWGANKKSANITVFKRNIFDPAYSGNQSTLYFETIKQNLEYIYHLLHDENISLTYRQEQYHYLCDEFSICGPGIFDLINSVYQNLYDSAHTNLMNWLAQFRTQLIGNLAQELHNKKFPPSTNKADIEKRRDYEKHTANVLYKLTESFGWNPSHQTEANNDIFTNQVKINIGEQHNALQQLNTQYTLENIIDFIHDKLQKIIDEKIAAEDIKSDKNHWIIHNTRFYTWLTNTVKSLFGKSADIYQLIEHDSMRGDPARACIKTKINSDYTYQQILICMEKQGLLTQAALDDKRCLIVDNRKFSHYFYFSLSTNLSQRWASIPDDYAYKILAPSSIDTANVAFLKKQLIHFEKARKIKSLDFVMEKASEKTFKMLTELNPVKLANNHYALLSCYLPLLRFSSANGERQAHISEYWENLSDDDMACLYMRFHNDYKNAGEKLPHDFIRLLAEHAVIANKAHTFIRVLNKFAYHDIAQYADYHLQLAAESGSFDILKFFFQVDDYATKKHMLLIAAESAINYGRSITLSRILDYEEAGAIFDINNQISLLHTAVIANEIECIQLVLKKLQKIYKNDEKSYVDYINKKILTEIDGKKYSLTALDSAVCIAKYDSISLLCKAKAKISLTLLKNTLVYTSIRDTALLPTLLKGDNSEINSQFMPGNTTPLEYIIDTNRSELLPILIQNGANPLLRDKNGDLPIHRIIKAKHSVKIRNNLLSLLLENSKISTTQAHKDEKSISYLSFVNEKDTDGNTPIHLIATKCNNNDDDDDSKPSNSDDENIILLLQTLTNVCGPNIQDAEGNTAVHVAVMTKNMQCLAFLVSHKNVNLNVTNKMGDTALRCAIIRCNLPAITYLFERKDKLDFNIPKNKAALQLAFQSNSPKFMPIKDFLHQHSFLTTKAYPQFVIIVQWPFAADRFYQNTAKTNYTHKAILRHFHATLGQLVSSTALSNLNNNDTTLMLNFLKDASIEKEKLLDSMYVFQKLTDYFVKEGFFTNDVYHDIVHYNKETLFLSDYFPAECHKHSWAICTADQAHVLLEKQFQLIDKANQPKTTSTAATTLFAASSINPDYKEVPSTSKNELLIGLFNVAVDVSNIPLLELLLKNHAASISDDALNKASSSVFDHEIQSILAVESSKRTPKTETFTFATTEWVFKPQYSA